MEVGPPDEPARGAERIICWFGIGMMAVFVILQIFMSIASPDIEFGFIHVLLPGVIGFIAVARLKGWVRRGGVS